MKRFMVVIMAAGIVAAAGSSAFAQGRGNGPRGPERRGMGAGGPMQEFLKNLPEEKRAEIMQKLRDATPEQRRQIMERVRAAAAPKDGEARRPAPPAAPPEAAAKRRAAAGRQGTAGANPIRQWLQRQPAERREQIVGRLRNASPEERQAFLRRFAERMRGAQTARRGQGRGGMQARRGMGQGRGGMQARRGMGRNPGRMQAGPERCRHCGEPQRGNRRGGMQAGRGGGRAGMRPNRGMGRGRMQAGRGMELRRPLNAPQGHGRRRFPIL